MNLSIDKAKELLYKNEYTCVVLKDDKEYSSRDRGVKPLLCWLNSDIDLEGAVVADKVVGKAAAFLYVLLKVEQVYAGVLSEPALKVLEGYNIKVSFGQKVSAIRNRDNTGFCPMETAVWDVDNPKEAHQVILDTLDKLKQGK